MVEELPWICLFVCVLALTQLQFRYCVPVMLASLKVLQAGTIVVLFRLWVNRDTLMEEWGQQQWTLEHVQEYLKHAAEAMSNRTEL